MVHSAAGMSVVVQIGGGKSAPRVQRGSTWVRDFARRTWMYLAVAMVIFAVGLGISVCLYIVLGNWQGRGRT